ncbi:hypothetical protein D9611_000780 [Ephemerocybe angulata]|uniref:Uncharacterized protein n=1 Tax=Ephemerocybe angulata TaxID=980116 RepID=A0A8H5BNX2_9AGAR|nr:hypothetical protein D9611_000780 [Tulosesus angulatus]
MSPIAIPNSLRSASIDLLANSHSTVATTPQIGVPKSRDIVPPSLLISEATEGPAIPPESSSAQLISPLESTTDLLSSVSLTALPGAKPSLCRLQTPSSVAGGKRRAVVPPPPLQLPSEITEFILAPMEASAALYPAQQLPGANPLHPITHTAPSTTGNNGAVSALSSIFNKALSLLKNQTSSATTGTSFTLTRIPPAPKFSHNSYGSAPPPCNGSTQTLSSTLSPTSTLKRAESPTTPTAASYSSQTQPPAHHPSQYQPQPPHLNRTQTQTSFSSASLLATPLPQPLLTFTDTTPYLTVYSSSGILEIREDELRTVGVEKAFWICVAVVYWGYMGDREGWVWAGEE